MKTTIIIQARMNSSRLPGKALKTIQNIPIIELITRRLKKSKNIDDILVATSNNKKNIKLIDFLKTKQIKYYLGSEEDVISRFYHAAKKNNSKIIVRITADCPLADPLIVDEFLEDFKKLKVDYLSNTNPWTYPDGLDVEVFSFKLLKEAYLKADNDHKKNGGVLISYLKDNKHYIVKNKKCHIKSDFKNIRLTIDEKVDLDLIRNIYDNFKPNIHFNYKQVEKFYKNNKKLFKKNSHLKLNEGSKLKKYQKIWRRATSIILGGNSLISKNPNMFLPGKWPTYFTKAKGYKIWDLDKRIYKDMSLMGVGTNILGYSNTQVDKAVIKAVKSSNMSTLNCVEEVYLAEKLIDMHRWAEKVKFARTGGEANALAIRIARACTSKHNIAFCGYHGWHDWYLAANLKTNRNLDSHLIPGLDPLGVPKNLINTSYSFNYGNYNQLKNLVEKKKIGIIKMEVSRNTLPNIKFLKQVRKLANKKNIILIFDECTSGFRQSFGGLHLSINIIPDIAIFGKALGNGYPITAVIGKNSVMENAKKSFMSSTFWTERIGPTAALKTLEIMEKDKTWQKITQLGKKLIQIWKKIAKRHKLKIKIFGLPSLAKFTIESKHSQEYKTFITQEMLNKGFLASNAVYMSTAHNDKILKEYEGILDEIFYKIALCEKQKIYIKDILKNPTSYLPFGRLN